MPDPQRMNRLMDLWTQEMRNLPQGTDKTPFQEFDPMMAFQALGRMGPAQQQTPMALRFLQLGQQMQPQPDDMILQLIRALLSPGGMKR